MKKVNIGSMEDRCLERSVRLPEVRVSLPRYRWEFTEEEKATIRSIIENRAPEKKIVFFIFELEYICGVKKEMLEQFKRKEMRERRSKILDDFRTVLKHLRKIAADELIVSRDEDIDQYEELTGMEWHSPLCMHDIIQPIEEYVKYLEQIKDVKRTGRDPANFDHFIGRVAGLYAEYIERPTQYVDGPFIELWKKLLIILGMPPRKYPEKTIKAALKLK